MIATKGKSGKFKRKLLCLFMALVFFMGSVPIPAIAAVTGSVDSIYFIKTKVKDGTTWTNQLVIYGTDFNSPQVFGGTTGGRPLRDISVSADKTTITIPIASQDPGVLSGEVRIKVKNNAGADIIGDLDGTIFNFNNTTTIDSVTPNKVYVGDPLKIYGPGATDFTSADRLYIAETEYSLAAATPVTVDNSDGVSFQTEVDGTKYINVSHVKSPTYEDNQDVRIVRNLGKDAEPLAPFTPGLVSRFIEVRYLGSISIANRISNLEVERVDPNTGAVGVDSVNIVTLYGKTGMSNFKADMKVYVSKDGVLTKGDTLELVMNGITIIGLRVKLPPMTTAGQVDIVIKTFDEKSEYVIKNGFIYVLAKNGLSINDGGIDPSSKKETEVIPVTIKGKNIGYFGGEDYTGLIVNTVPPPQKLGNVVYGTYPDFQNTNFYKIKYTGIYNGGAYINQDVVIIRQVLAIINTEAPVVDASLSSTDDSIIVMPQNVATNIPLKVDVTLKTKTTVFVENPNGSTGAIITERAEEYTKPDAFTYIPNKVFPVINKISPISSEDPLSIPATSPEQEVYITIEGSSFEVKYDEINKKSIVPTITLSNGTNTRVLDKTLGGVLKDPVVYDDKNKVVDGTLGNTLGTKIKARITKGSGTIPFIGKYDVYVKNPSAGENKLDKGFEFINPAPGVNLPIITSAIENYSDIVGGETVRITGQYIEKNAVITIDGVIATITTPVSGDGRTVSIKTPPGTAPGPTMLQIINETGGLASFAFEYKKVTTSPKITKVMPVYGTKGTKLIIKGESFILPDTINATPTEPEFKGSYVMFGDHELNAYNYNALGELTVNGSNSIYYSDSNIDGHMVEVIDSNTIYVTVPDNFYSFKAPVPDTGSFLARLLATPLTTVDPYRIEVRNPDGARTKENFTFKYMKPATKPVIDSITPNIASVNGGAVVTIKGSDYVKDGLAVYFGTETSKKIEYVSSTELRVLVPAYTDKLPAGKNEVAVPVSVLNSDGGTAVYFPDLDADKFMYRIPDSNPVIKGLLKDNKPFTKGSTSGGDIFILDGADFRRKGPGDEEPKVYINGISATVVWFQSPNDPTKVTCQQLRVTTPASTVEGPVDIVLVNYDAGTAIYKGFSYVRTSPVMKTFTPNLISIKGNTNGYIVGTGFTKWGNISQLVTKNSIAPSDPALPPDPDPTGKEKVTVGVTPTDADEVINTLVYFGDGLTGDKKTIFTESGTEYTIMDNLKIEAIPDPIDPQLVNVRIFLIKSDESYTEKRNMAIAIGAAHLFILTAADVGKTGIAEEGVLVRVIAGQVIIQRRVATQAILGDRDINAGNSYSSVLVTTPPFNTTGKRTAYLENTDGAIASIAVEVTNPLSNPKITKIMPKSAYKDNTGAIKTIPIGGGEPTTGVSEWYTYIPLVGGVQMTIEGSDFRDNVKVYLDNKLIEILDRNIAKTKMTIKIPAGTAIDYNKLKPIIIVNEDGGSANSARLTIPHFIMYKDATSKPTVKSLSKLRTSQNIDASIRPDPKLNTVILNGFGFIPGMRAFIGNVECPAVEPVDPNNPNDDTQMLVTIPDNLPLGLNTLQVINPDNGFFELKNAITVVSDPVVMKVYNAKGAEISPLHLSVEGGQKLKLTGKGFTTGAKVIVGGKLVTKASVTSGTTNVISCTDYKDREMVIVGGVPATAVQLVTSTSEAPYLTLTTPRQTIGTTSIIVLASDAGVSNIIEGDYQKPYPDKPDGLVATPVDSDTVKLEWPTIEGVRYYEVYICKSTAFKLDSANDKYEYKGSITPIDLGNGVLRSFIEGLQPNTYYSFKLKSVNNFGASNYSNSSAKYIDPVKNKPVGFVRTMASAITDYFQTTTNYKNTFSVDDKLSYQGRMSILTAGERSMASKLLVVAYNKPQFILNDPKVLDINVDLLKKYNDVTILLDDYSLSLKLISRDMITVQAELLGSTIAKDSKMRLTLDKRQGSSADQIKIRIPSGYGMVLQPMKVGLDLYQGKKVTPQSSFKNNIAATFKYASTKTQKFPGGVYVAYYNTYTKKLELLSTVPGTGKADSQILKTGSYIVLGKKTK